jgi:hypothetical protein
MGLENTLIEHWNGSAWTIVPSPNGSGFNSLEGVAVASSNDVWAVGYRVDTAETGKTLMEHWNGSRWTLVNGPSIPTYSELDGIALGSNSMWAVGFSAYENAHTLTERLDGSAWTIVPSPNPVDLPGAASLNSVVVIAPDNIWVVGYYLNGNNKQTLAQVWDGTRWYTRSSPNASTHDNILTAVAVVSANEIWAVGFYVNDSGVTRTLTEQWNGSAWTIIPSPNQGAGGNVLSAVSANPANGNLRAVGHYVRAGGALEALSEHWTGSAWTLDPITLPTGGDNGFYGVEIAATNNIWEVGYFTDTSSGRVHTLIEHYDGSAWTIVPSPNQPGDNTLLAVTSLSATDIWAVGSYTNGTTRTLTEHWNGSAWTIVPSPNQGSGNNTLYAVAATSAIDVWAVGTSNNGTTQTLAERWDGSSWTLSTSPSPGSSHNSLAGAAASAGNIWSVGFYDSPGTQSLPLIELHSNCAPRPTFTPVPPTPCPITFSDVHPSDYFYIPVQYLACEGDISGYSDGTFRPFNNTTRGQLSKIVTLAEGWTLNTSGGPHFSDVTASNAFYGYIETAYNNGVISGYADGTFRPGNNVTRAQLSKIIVIAQHWPVDTTGGPHFTDVLTTDPFYTFIETAYNRGIISGYADGTFRPGNNATRGQIAKIVYSAVTSP